MDKTTLDKIKKLLAGRDAEHGAMQRDDAGNVLAPHTEDDWDDVTAKCERDVYQLIDALVAEIENPPAGKWTFACDWYGDGGDTFVIHAVGDDEAAARRDAARQVREYYTNASLKIPDSDWVGREDDFDGDTEDEAYIVAMFLGHHEEIRF